MGTKLSKALVAIGLVIASLFIAQPASAATGSWQPYGSSFSTPSNWYCSSTSNGTLVSSQVCIVRSGAYVQAATIVRNLSSSQVIVSVDDHRVQPEVGYVDGRGSCAPSGVAPVSVSVCFGPTVVSYSPTRAIGTVRSGGYGFGNSSPWA